MDQKIILGELISMNSELPGIIHIIEGEKVCNSFLGQITFGRDRSNTNCIDDNRIAQFHCSLFLQDGLVVLKNHCQQGTFINQEKMGLEMELNLKHGDHINLLCLRAKKEAEKHVLAYMFIRYENKKQSARKQSKREQQIIEQIGNNLDCIICSEMFYEGVAVSPCGHVFCGYCLQGWEERNKTCPICRVKMTNVTKAFLINKIINGLLEQNPALQIKPKPQNKYYPQAAQNGQQNESDSDNSEFDSEIEEEIIRIIQINQQRRRQINNNAVQAIQPRLPQVAQQAHMRVDQYFQQNLQEFNIQQRNRQAVNAHGNQLRVNQQVNQQRVNDPPRQDVNQQRPPAQANQQRDALPNQQNAQLNQPRPNAPIPNGQVNQPRANALPPMNQAALNNQQRANPPPPIVVAHVEWLDGPCTAFEQIQVRVNINHPPLLQNVRQDIQVQAQQMQGNIQVIIQQQAQYQNQQPQIIQQQLQQQNLNQPLQRNKECRSCHVQFKGFQCQNYAQHKYCFCFTKIPSRNLNIYQNADLKLFCQVCKSSFCKYYYDQICEESRQCDIKDLISYRDVFSFQDNYFNNFERERIQRHLGQRDQAFIFDYMMQQQISKGQFNFKMNKALFQNVHNDVNELLLPNSPVCTKCIRDVKNQIIFRYVQSLRFKDEQFMMLGCCYGINCRRQNDDYHARSYNHICEQTKFD
ncbi:hypothetical protein pb186bvf_007534 [Paramecium bursaria]